MKIGLSKKKKGEERHITLVAPLDDEWDFRYSITSDVLENTVRPVRETFRKGEDGTIMVRYRFSTKWLENLMLTFPQAEFSQGLDRLLTKQALLELQAMQVPDLDLDDFGFNLRDFQKIGTGKIVDNKCFLLNDEMGLGKTIQALAAITIRESYPALIIVPNSIRYNWLKMGRQATDADIVVVGGTTAERREQVSERADITIINTESLRIKREYKRNKDGTIYYDEDKNPVVIETPRIPELYKKKYKMVVVDEFHRFKNPEAQQTLGLHKIRGKYKLGMSGTPMLNGRPEEMWSILHWMYPEGDYADYNVFVNRITGRTRGNRIVSYNPKELRRLKKFWHAQSLRRRKDHVEDELPEVINVDRYVELTTEQRRLYDKIRDELILYIKENPKKINNALAQMTRLKQAAFSPELYEGSKHSAKIDELRTDVEELVASGQKAIIFTQWKRGAIILAREFEQYNPALVHGGVPVEKGNKARGTFKTPRQNEIDRFNEDEDCHLFIGSIKACMEGFSLGAASYVLHMDETWVPTEKDQATARSAAGGLRGAGSKHSHVHVITYRAVDTIEEEIESLLAQKRAMNDRMIEQDGGLRVERITMDDIRSLLGA